jgi:hypothetical protein
LELNSKKLGRGFFQGEGFIMQKNRRRRLAFVHSGGTCKKELRAGEVLKVDTGCIVASKMSIYIEFIGGIKNSIFGGEGLFYATLRGPGTVYIQSYLSADSLTELLLQHLKQVEVAVVKEAYWGLGNLLDGEIIVINRQTFQPVVVIPMKEGSTTLPGFLLSSK